VGAAIAANNLADRDGFAAIASRFYVQIKRPKYVLAFVFSVHLREVEESSSIVGLNRCATGGPIEMV
jgi:hypothetical protein